MNSSRTSNSSSDEYNKCPICLRSLDHELLKFKVCDHILHKKCAEEFLKHNIKNCPVCRRNLYPRRANLVINV